MLDSVISKLQQGVDLDTLSISYTSLYETDSEAYAAKNRITYGNLVFRVAYLSDVRIIAYVESFDGDTNIYKMFSIESDPAVEYILKLIEDTIVDEFKKDVIFNMEYIRTNFDFSEEIIKELTEYLIDTYSGSYYTNIDLINNVEKYSKFYPSFLEPAVINYISQKYFMVSRIHNNETINELNSDKFDPLYLTITEYCECPFNSVLPKGAVDLVCCNYFHVKYKHLSFNIFLDTIDEYKGYVCELIDGKIHSFMLTNKKVVKAILDYRLEKFNMVFDREQIENYISSVLDKNIKFNYPEQRKKVIDGFMSYVDDQYEIIRLTNYKNEVWSNMSNVYHNSFIIDNAITELRK